MTTQDIADAAKFAAIVQREAELAGVSTEALTHLAWDQAPRGIRSRYDGTNLDACQEAALRHFIQKTYCRRYLAGRGIGEAA